MGERERLGHAGFSLAEVLVVLAILVIVYGVVNLSLEPTEIQKLEAASAEIVDALFFARAEALRSGGEYGVRFGADTALGAGEYMVSVFKKTGGNEVLIANPVSGRPYQFDVHHAAYGNGVTMVNPDFDGGTAVVFNGGGGRAGAPELAATGRVTVSLGAVSRTVTVDAETGRILVQ